MNFIKQMFRKLLKSSTAMLFGLLGLIVGLVCVMYIFFWTSNELSYNHSHKNLDRIFVVHAYLKEDSKDQEFGGAPPAVAPAIKNEYPEIETTARYIPGYEKTLIAYESTKSMQRVAYADFSMFDIFTFHFLSGSRGFEGADKRMVISQTTAKTLFGDENPVGKLVRYDNLGDYTIAGVVKDAPANSAIKFDAVIPLENLSVKYGDNDVLNTWYNNGFNTYGLLSSPSGFRKIESTVTNRIQKDRPESTNFLKAYLFKDQYLYKWGALKSVKIFSLVGLLVLVTAILNFINLMTARLSKQAKKTGIQKSLGASQTTIIYNIYKEVAFICALAFVLSFLIALAGLPLFSSLVGKKIAYDSFLAVKPLLTLVGLYLLTILLSGLYPAIRLSRFAPVDTLKPSITTVKNNGTFRNALIVSIFIISIMLLSSTLIIRKQISLLSSMDLGFNKEQLLYIELKGKLQEKANTFKTELANTPGVHSASVTSHLPSSIYANGEGWEWDGKDANFKPLITFLRGDEDLAKTLGVQMIEGSFFTNNTSGVVINQALADIIGWESFIGKTLRAGDFEIRIAGVINNFVFNRFSHDVSPLLIFPTQGLQSTNFLIARIEPQEAQMVVKQAEKLANNLEPDQIFQYGFVDDSFNELLASERNLSKLVGVFSVFAILVLAFGLLGVILFLAEQKTKEIGVRKCMGESVTSLIMRFIRPFVISGIIASVVAVPVTWYFMQKWLQSYAYQFSLSVWIFLLALLVILAVAILTVSWQSWRAASRNPVEALRYE